ncbi:BON domain-containing protein [Rhizobium sp. BK376]|uniref:BON domain-containing protein n=1 Tax=Rhizobium sp. BK376 TaxID=2512149 RepID=UPI00104961DA|nr:BON domain-containing protein [Rhizobium sp. BK376]TCR75605.1 osmotically-inducible protein OsmY [Rhizobium sp. BK376]
MDDNLLKQSIIDELDFEPSVDAASVAVTVKDGVVTLGGHVRTYSERDAAERVAARVKGVRGIAQDILVQPHGANRLDDDGIAARALSMIDWNVNLPRDAIKVRVAAGYVTLTGTVEWQYQKDAAWKAVRNLEGVVGVRNGIEIVPSVDASDIKKRIEDAFERDAELKASAIKVDVSGSKVTLKGTVQTFSERKRAERAAWSAAGVSTLEDRILIGEA